MILYDFCVQQVDKYVQSIPVKTKPCVPISHAREKEKIDELQPNCSENTD